MPPGTPDQQSPPNPPPPPSWSTPAQPGWDQPWAVPPPPDRRNPGEHRLNVLIAIAATAAVLVGLAVGSVALVRYRAPAHVPNIAALLSLPPDPTIAPLPSFPPDLPTPIPVAAVQPLPTTLPTGPVIAGAAATPLAWTPLNDGIARVTLTPGGVDVALVRLEQRYWFRAPVSTEFQAMRLDATVTVTADSAGNRVGLGCKSTDNQYGATFSIDASGQWYMSLDWPNGPTLLANAQSPAIHPPGTANTLSIVCANSGASFRMMYAINGSVVADEVSPILTSQPWHPDLYLCSCNGTEGMRDVGVTVRTLQG